MSSRRQASMPCALAFASLLVVGTSSAATSQELDFYSLGQSDRAQYCEAITDQVITTEAGQQQFKGIFESFYTDEADNIDKESMMNDLINEQARRYQETPEASASGVWGMLNCNELYVIYLNSN